MRGYYALPLLWRERVVGWANAALEGSVLRVQTGFVATSAPHGRDFSRALDEEIEALRVFLGADRARRDER